MPYYITDNAEGCAGWATIKEDGEVIGCHTTKQEAIDQMVAVSIAEGLEPGGERQVDLTVPAYIRDAAARGLELRAEGEGGDGLVARTIREARLMADGQISEDKVIRASAWAARHLVDLDAPQNSNPDNEDYPGAGAVAFFLWGINPLDPQPATQWFDRKAEQIREEEGRSTHPDTMLHMENGIETRRICINDFEIRNGETGDGMTFSGYAAVFNSDSEPLPFIERIQPGAFQRTLGSRNEIKMFVNHDTSRILASKRAGTLRLSEDQHGLRVDADLPDTTDGRDMAVLLQRGDIDSMSFGFSIPKGGDSWSDDGQRRELHEVRLHEVSIVTGFPAYAATTAAVRSLDALSERTGLDANALNQSITKLENGEELTADEAALIDEAVNKLRTDVEDAAANLARKRKELDLLLHAV